MKWLPSVVAIQIMLSGVLCAQHCTGPTAQRAVVGGNSIDGSVSLLNKPLQTAQVRLLLNGKPTWSGSTDNTGSFHIKGLRAGTYRLFVAGWGRATVRVDPDLTKPYGNGQRPYYALLLADNECVMTLLVMN